MTQSMAQVTCPNCRKPFPAPVDQILDTELDPSAKSRLLSGQVNVVGCPHCGMTGMLNMPFIYHDPDKELALVLMPMEAGRTDLERQQLIGSMSRAVMSQLPPEQKKGYLLNPQVFISYESLINRVLEAEGITQEMLDLQRKKSELLRSLLAAESADARRELIDQNIELIDQEFFQVLYVNIERVEMIGHQPLLQTLLDLRQQLFEETAAGRELAQRTQVVQALRAEPTREKLLQLLIENPDREMRLTLITLGQTMVDYAFFQQITQHLETTNNPQEREQLQNLRQQVLEIRKEMQEQVKQVVEARAQLLRGLLTTEKPEILARRHLDELDELFFSILAAEVERAEQAGNKEATAALQNVWELTMRLIQQQIPPELALLNLVMEAESAEQVDQILQQNRELVSPPFVQMLEQVENELQERGAEQSAQKAAAALQAARAMVKSAEKPQPEPKKPVSGLEIARR